MDKKLGKSIRDILGYLFIAVSVIMLGKSLMLCFSSDIWYDELFTVGMIKHSYGDLIAFTARDVHPPLYYCIVKFFVDLCKLISAQANPVVIAKIVSVLPYFILLIYSVSFIRKRFGIFTGGLFLFCVIAMPQLSAYTVEVRMYSWALLFVTAAFLHAYGTIVCGSTERNAKKSKGESIRGNSGENRQVRCGDEKTKQKRRERLHGVALVFYGLVAAYTQYFACVAVIMVYLYVLVVFLLKDRSRIKEWLLWVAVSIVGYVPWLYALLKQITAVNENYWILPLTWRSLGGCVKFIMKPAFTNEILNTVLAVVMFAAYLFVFVYEFAKLYHRGRQMHKIWFGFATAGVGVLAGLVVFGFVASFIVRPIFVYRYMIPALGCFWLGFAVNLDSMLSDVELCKLTPDVKNDLCKLKSGNSNKLCKPYAATKLVSIISALIMLCILVTGLRNYRAFMGEEEYKILLMKQTDEALSSIAPDDIVIYNFDQVQAVTSYYLDSDTLSYLWCGTPETLIQDIIRPYDTVEDAQVIKEWCENGRKVWFVGSFNSRDDIVEEWSSEGMHIEETGSYLLERYWFNLYKVSI